MAEVPSFSTLFVHTCTRTTHPVPPPMIRLAFSVFVCLFVCGVRACVCVVRACVCKCGYFVKSCIIYCYCVVTLTRCIVTNTTTIPAFIVIAFHLQLLYINNLLSLCCRPRKGTEKVLVNIMFRETAPSAAHRDMFVNNLKASTTGT